MSFIGNFFRKSREQDEPVEEIEHIEIDFESDTEEDQDNISYLGENIHIGIPSIYITNARLFINNTKNWAFNREINEAHIKNLQDELETSKNPFFVGTIKIAIDSENRIRILDGQHRAEALRRVLKSNDRFNMNIILEVYNVPDINGIDSIVLFSKCNTVLNIKDSDIPNTIYANVTNKLINDYKGSIKPINPKTTREPNFPSISESRLFKELSKSGLIEKFELNDIDLLRIIKIKNSELAGLTLDEIFPYKLTSKERERYEKAWLKCCKTGFFLGLKIGKNKELTWIHEIYNELKNTKIK